MKKYRFLLLLFVLGFIYMGCEENDIDVYDETPRLNLYYRNLAVHFRDSDYVKGNTEKEWLLGVDLQGYRLTEDKSFCMKVRPNDAYTLKADVSFCRAVHVSKRFYTPDLYDKGRSAGKFDNNESLPGRHLF